MNGKKSGVLYIIATPIGNLEDITLRALRLLKEVDFVICEDTRRAQILFQHYDITQERVSFHAQSKPTTAEKYVERIKKGENVAFITDAGTPGISDPAFRLLQAAYAQNIMVIPVPGASALPTLLSVAGIPTSPLVWHGFLPHKKGRQTKMQQMLVDYKVTHAFYESVHRILKCLIELEAVGLGDRFCVIGRELTKKFEEVLRGTVSELRQYFEENTPKGEFVVVIAPEKFLS